MSIEYLVTGGAGFIGSCLVKTLINRGKTVRVLDRVGRGTPGVLPESHSGLEVMQGDIQDPATCARAVKGVRYVLHLAAETSVPQSIVESAHYHSVNVAGTLNVMDAARAEGVSRFVLSSSCSIYGDGSDRPIVENSPMAPGTPYALTKKINEDYCRLYESLFDFPSCVLRYFNVYGPGQSCNSDYAAVIPVFVQNCLKGAPLRINGDGEQTRDFVFVEDVVRANLAACELNEMLKGETFNIGSGESVSIRNLANMICESVGISVELHVGKPIPGEVRHSISDIGHANKILEWRPSVKLKEGLDQTVEWMKRKKDEQ